MHIVCFSSTKGGVGKSTLTILCARYLTQVGYRVLCLDADIQNSLTFYFLTDNETLHDHNLYQACQSQSLEGHILPIRPRLSLVASHRRMATLHDLSPTAIASMLHRCDHQFDYCLMDSSPFFCALSVSLYTASHHIITPLGLTQFEWKSAMMLKKQIAMECGSDAKLKFVFNRFIPPKTLNPKAISNQYLEMFTQSFHDALLTTRIPEYRTLSKLIDTETLITRHKLTAKLFISIRDFVAEVFRVTREPEEF